MRRFIEIALLPVLVVAWATAGAIWAPGWIGYGFIGCLAALAVGFWIYAEWSRDADRKLNARLRKFEDRLARR